MRKILVISNGESDLLKVLRDNCDVLVISPEDSYFDTDGFDSLCILAGNMDTPFNPPAQWQYVLNKMREEKKPVFCEYLGSIGATRKRSEFNTERMRMVYSSKRLVSRALTDGDLFDAQSNSCIRYAPKGENSYPVLTYKNEICAHSNVSISEDEFKSGDWALWWFDENTLISSIRLCNFNRARFAPMGHWKSLITSIVSFLCGEDIAPVFDSPLISYQKQQIKCADDALPSINHGIGWIYNSEILKNNGAGGAYEGFYHRIMSKDGYQPKNKNIRADCSGEIGGALLFYNSLCSNPNTAESAELLFKFIFDWLQVKEGEHKGMIRWSEAAWETCFQDDVARTILPLLLYQHFGKDVPYMENIKAALDYMVDTTGSDGIRTKCTEICTLDLNLRDELKKEGSGEPCAHFNAYYHAVLLLAYRVCGKEDYLDLALKGLTTLMHKYPNTCRETSETEECARLILPLAILYGITKDREHYEWLHRVTEDMQRFRHSCGGYSEWDTDYRAFCSRNHKGECALLANNGDPVADLLYSNNWLPLGFSYAYMVTGEEYFYRRWTETASFIASSQIHSENKNLDGAWARAFDMNMSENYGMPHDVGWGPCCIESGWTVGEILTGLQFMKIAEKERGKLTL